MNPLTTLSGIGPLALPLAIFSAIALLARPAHAPERDLKSGLYLTPHWHIASPEITRHLKGAYPATVAALADKWNRVFSVPVSWIRSQAYAESRNIPTAENTTSGALGVLQLLPSTVAWLVPSLLKSKYAKNNSVQMTLSNGWHGKLNDLFNPDVNVMLAAYYLTILRRKFGDKHDLVAAAYNVGPGKVARSLEARRPLPEGVTIYVAMVEDAKRRGFK
jgi:Soluble lytic murein transglycosylase and related regulatory proteins (some contain LysM/invasin domains)